MSKKSKKPQARTPAMPPKLPLDDDEFERAIMLLGTLAKGTTLTNKTADELEEILGVIPSLKVAAFWKTELKKLRKERLEQDIEQDSSTPAE